MEDKKKRLPGSLVKVIMIIAAVIAVLCVTLAVILKLTYKPTVLRKTEFSDKDKSVIASELHIPEGSFEPKEIYCSHAKDTYFRITLTAGSEDILSSYETRSEGGSVQYLLRDKDDPHGDITCTVLSEQPLELEFELHTYNKRLYRIVK
ncbi:MAG: hypothetical protein IJ737_00340 [Ruminococcus sp.]|nr:hypothetical protein [Ruminococcus sp.]